MVRLSYLLGFSVDKLDSSDVNGQNERVWMRPESLVGDVVEHTPIERVVLH